MKIRVQVKASSCYSYNISELTQEKFAEIVKNNNGKVPMNCDDWANFADDYGGDEAFSGIPIDDISVWNVDNVDENDQLDNWNGDRIECDDIESKCKFSENNHCSQYTSRKWLNPKAAVAEIVSKGNVAVCCTNVYGTNENVGGKWVLDVEGEFDPAKLEFFYFDSMGDNAGKLVHHVSYNGKDDDIGEGLSIEETKKQAFRVCGYKGE